MAPAGPSAEDGPLYRQIVTLMEERKLFRRKNLKMSDVASALGTNTRYVSAAINAQGTSFVEFVNGSPLGHGRSGYQVVEVTVDGFTVRYVPTEG